MVTSKTKMKNDQIGKWAFLIGLIIAVIAAFVPSTTAATYGTYIALALFILGLIVGFLNITEKDLSKFLLAVIVLLVLGSASLNVLDILKIVNDYLKSILGNFIAFVSAAGLVVSIKSILEASKK